MAGTIDAALTRLRRDGFGHLLSLERFEQLCHDQGQLWRVRVLSPAVTLRLFLLQVLHGNVAINALRHLSGLSFAAASYCQARARLPRAALGRLLLELTSASSVETCDAATTGTSPRIYVADSTSFSTCDTPQLRKRFGLPHPRRVGVSYPVGMVMGLLDLASGLFVRATAFDVFRHDQPGVISVHQALRDGDILVGDRAFCSYCHIALLNRRGVRCCFRVHQTRIVTRLGVVRWSKRRMPCPPWMTRRQFDALPNELTVRIVRQVITHKGYRSRVMLLATTLLDRHAWSDARVGDLYRQRWQVETCFAHLKTTMNMGVLKCKSVQGVLKELTVYLLVYNLVRLLMLRWAKLHGVHVRRVSFIDALRLLCMQAMGLAGVERLVINPDRTGRRQLRVRRRRPRHYTWLTQPRRDQSDLARYGRRR